MPISQIYQEQRNLLLLVLLSAGNNYKLSFFFVELQHLIRFISIRGPGYVSGPDLLDFVIYRPDELVRDLYKDLEPELNPKLDKIRIIMHRVKDDFKKCVQQSRGMLFMETAIVSIKPKKVAIFMFAH